MSRTIEKRPLKVSSFLTTLREMLNNQPPENISWTTENNGFTIKNPSIFSQEVLPKYFKHSNLSSFIRQLNIYDFKKVPNQKYPDWYIYSHPYFKKNDSQLMNKIYRKGHQLSQKNRKYTNEDIPYSSDSFQHSISHDKKKLIQEIEKLRLNLAQIQSMNQMICEQNMELESKIPTSKKFMAESFQFFYKILIQSYEVQYRKFVEKIRERLIEQAALMTELYQRHKQSEFKSYQFFQNISKKSTNSKKKSESTNYNSNSSGGQLNGHKSHRIQPIVKISNDKLSKRQQKKNDDRLPVQNDVKLANRQKFRKENKIPILGKALKSGIKNMVCHQEVQSQSNSQQKMKGQNGNQGQQNVFSQRQIRKQPRRCVIELKNRKGDQHNQAQKLYKAIVRNKNQINEGKVSPNKNFVQDEQIEII